MILVFALVAACAVFLVVLAFLAFKFPHGRSDWTRDKSETVGILATITTFTLLFLLLWYVSATVDWPSWVVITFWTAVCMVVGLIVVSIMFPEGFDITEIGKEKEP